MSLRQEITKNFIYFDDARTNFQQVSTTINTTIKELKKEDEKGNDSAKVLLYLYEGLYSLIEAEKKYRSAEYSRALKEFEEANKMINRFQRMSSGFSIEFQQEAERLDLFINGRIAECHARAQNTTLSDKKPHLLEASNAYTLEAEVVEKTDKFLLAYNALARAQLAQGFLRKLEGEQALSTDHLRHAKRKLLDAFNHFIKAAYYNPSYTPLVTETDNMIDSVMKNLIINKANVLWKKAFEYSNVGNFLESSNASLKAAKLYERASKLEDSTKEQKKKIAHSFMLKASSFEAEGNENLKNQNNAGLASRPFERAAKMMKNAIEAYPQRDKEDKLYMRWEIQEKYYQGLFEEVQGIALIDKEDFSKALPFFKNAIDYLKQATKLLKKTDEKGFKKLIEKTLAEVNGYIGMCKTVLD
ncbi:MAG: hypothetical protein U9O98_00860 [Asgard group archaeon]|nr:hypothetical protein [Asgard group archaeon]